MNFYKHHIGDYAQATAHLSFVEDAAYSRMIRKYYAEERPLPADVNRIVRLIGARTKEEKEAVQVILDEYFTLEPDGYHNKRCDEELGKYGAQAETNRRIAAEREAKKAAERAAAERERIVQEDATNRATNRSDNEHESLNESSTLTGGSREPSQIPDTRSQEKPTPPTPSADAEHPGTNGHDLLGGAQKRPKRRPAKFALIEGWYPSESTIEWLNGFLAEHGLSEDWGQRQHTLFIGKAKSNAWVYADWDQAYRNFMRENGPGGRFWSGK